MNVLSLFDGMSCGQIALERSGIKVDNYYASEIDKYAIAVTQKNYPETKQLGDISNWREWNIDWKSIDLVFGGSPCQGFSFAGKQLAFDDPRSKLFFTFVDILNHIKLVNPEVKFLLENVKMKKEFLDVISSYLGVDPKFINSSLVSAQNRQRFYWSNIIFDVPEDKGIVLNDILDGFVSDRDKSYCIDANYGKGSNIKRYFHRSSRQIVFKKGHLIAKPGIEEANTIGKEMKGLWRKLSVNECELLQTIDIDHTVGVPEFERYKMLGNGWTVDVISHIFEGLK